MAGSALFVDDAARRGQSGARAAAGTMLARVADTVAFTVVLVVGFVYLYLQHNLRAYEITGAAGWLRGVLGWIQQAVTRVATMMLTMTSLRVPAAAATVVTLAFRGLTFWLPLAFGFFTLRRLPVFRAPRTERSD